jgi:DNA-binding response OmpR family regulator
MSISTSPNSIKDTLLIVDDDPVNLGIVAGFLETVGFRVHTVDNGARALEQAPLVHPDLILLDVMMPGIDGFEVCQRLKANPQTKNIPVIFMTSLTEIENKIRGFEVGAVDYVTKPMRPQEILARVNTHLEIRHLTRNLENQARELQKTNDELLNVTDDLRDANLNLSRRAIQLEACNRVAQHITSILNLDQLLPEVVNAIQNQFGYYFVGIWLLNEAQTQILPQVGTSRNSEQTLQPNLSINLEAEKSIVAWVCRHGEAYLAENVETDPHYLPQEGLPGTRSELALPLKIGPTLVGVLNILSDQPAKFDDEDKRVLQTLANQIAIAIHNAWKYQLEQRLHSLEIERAAALAQLNADKDKFFSIISHDLRTPFNNVLGNARIMAKHFDELSEKELRDMSQSVFKGKPPLKKKLA